MAKLTMVLIRMAPPKTNGVTVPGETFWKARPRKIVKTAIEALARMIKMAPGTVILPSSLPSNSWEPAMSVVHTTIESVPRTRNH